MGHREKGWERTGERTAPNLELKPFQRSFPLGQGRCFFHVPAHLTFPQPFPQRLVELVRPSKKSRKHILAVVVDRNVRAVEHSLILQCQGQVMRQWLCYLEKDVLLGVPT